jgi:hypothetical protein
MIGVLHYWIVVITLHYIYTLNVCSSYSKLLIIHLCNKCTTFSVVSCWLYVPRMI